MELGFGWVDVVYTVARLFIAASFVYFLCMMIRLWNVLEIWSPRTLRALLGKERDETSPLC
jgi:hypothetical protein